MKDQRNIQGKGSFTKALASMAALVLALILTLTSCGGAAGTSDTDSGITAASTETSSNAASKAEMFTDRDLSADYDESSAVTIELSGTSAQASSTNGVSVSGSTVTITKEGTYIVSGSLTDGQIIVEADDTAKVQIVLNGAEITSKTSAAIYVKSADKVFVTTAKGTDNTLANGGSFTPDGDTNIDGAVFAKDDITFNGSGTITVNSPAGHGIVGKDDVKLAGGIITVNAANHGVQANDSVRVAQGTFTINADAKDGVHVSDNADAEEGTTSDSFFYMADGSLIISAGDDGIHADAAATVEGGSIDVSKSYEGLEALAIKISGGDIKVAATDDGFNAAGGNNASSTNSQTFGADDWGGGKGGFSDGGTDGLIEISGGIIYITAGGDGVDSNGSVTISGGYTVVCGPTQGDTSVLDYNVEGTITGGTFIGTGGAGMASNFNSVENQGLIAVSVGNQSAGTAVTLTDESGKTIAEVTPELDYAVVYVSTPDMAQGSTYTLTAGSYSESIELTESAYSTLGGGMGGRGNMQGGMNGGNMTPPDGSQQGGPSANGEMPHGGPRGGGKGMRGPGENNGQMNNIDSQSADAVSGASEMSGQA